MPTTRTTRAPREEARKARNDVYRSHILDVAEQVFADRGFDSAKLQDISERAGLAMGTIYAIFPGKDELFHAILDDKGQEVVGLVRGVVARALPPREQLDLLIETYIDYFVARPNFLRMHLRAGTSWVVSPDTNAESRALIWREVHAMQAEIFRRGIETGVFIEDDPAFLARLFSAMDQVLLAEWVGGGMKSSRDDLVVKMKAIVERSFCKPPR